MKTELQMAKHTHNDEDDNENVVRKKMKLLPDDEKLVAFQDWMRQEGFLLFNVSVSKRNVASGWGLVADKDITEGDVLFTVPRSVLLHPCTVSDELKVAIEAAGEELDSGSSWVPLLLCLLHEYDKMEAAACGFGGRWQPYFNMVPDFDDLHLPMMWSKEELNEELKGTNLLGLLDRDLKSLTFEFEHIVVPFVKKHPQLFNADNITLHHFKKMVSFVMAYSFTEPKKPGKDDDDDDDDDEDDVHPPMMVPLADILNHASENNAFIRFRPQCLEMLAKRNIKKNEEIFNTYGELSNEQLLHMYGYAEHPTLALYDTVDIPLNDLRETFLQMNTDQPTQQQQQQQQRHQSTNLPVANQNAPFIDKKWSYLTKLGYIADDGCLVLSHDGVLTEKMMNSIMKNMSKLPDSYKMLLNKLATRQLGKYGRSLEEEEELMKKLEEEMEKNNFQPTQQAEHSSTSPDGGCTQLECTNVPTNMKHHLRTKLYSSYVRCGQMRLLQKLTSSTLGGFS
ncbi:hypothetical protein HELRODRAFT_193766 [Helobdella robusta]|uniref:SET domain-containing protein n=1 Tax=Helobdella robusta TaxID=6412 RepID=T1FVC2_HELRO|nr:hypothetical protein HELRODRAFT_193766 [Helobdella robusta]ESN94930.1 hypothetical protein HELRODRAFT_193766 [Helobdella robusta]